MKTGDTQKSAAKPEPTAKVKPAAKPEPTAKVKPAAKPEPTAKAKPAAKPEPTAKAKPAAKPESTAKVKPAAKPEPTAKAKPAVKPEPTAKAKPAVKPESTSEIPLTKESQRNISHIFDSFIDNMKSIELFYKRLSPAATTEDNTINQEFTEQLLDAFHSVGAFDNVKDSTKDSSKESPELSLNQQQTEKLNRKLAKLAFLPTNNYNTLASGSFIMLNNYFEYVISDLLKYNFTKHTGTIDTKKLSISVGELKNYNSIDDLYEEMILREIESFLFDLNFEERKNYLKDQLGIELEENIINWNSINEIRERRHIIIHNDSVVNKKYLNKTGNPYNLELGKKLSIDDDYFNIALNHIKTAGLLLIFNCWGNWDKQNTTKAVREILDLSFDNLISKDYQLVIDIYRYAENRIKARNDEEDGYLHRTLFNYCISLKRTGQQKELDSRLKHIKTGVASPIFKIAHHILKDNLREAVELLPKAIIADDLTIDEYNEWPMFEEMRNDGTTNQQALEILLRSQPE